MNIAVLISGGVDSAVGNHLLCKQGYKPDRFYIKIGMEEEDYTDGQVLTYILRNVYSTQER